MPVKIKVDIKASKKYFNNLKSKIENHVISQGLSKIVLESRKDVIPYTPRGKGGLMNSWKVEKKKLSVEAGFDIAYAMYQHQGRREDGSYRIVNRPAGGQSFFLKVAIGMNKDKYQSIMVDQLNKIL